MAKIEFTLDELYRDTFGYVGKPFPLGELALPSVGGSVAAIGKAILRKNDFLGRPYFMPVKLNGVWLPNSPTMSLSVQKKIIKTVVPGRKGTVKELISTDDYVMQIRGFAINFDDNDYPYEDVDKIKDLFEENKSISIESDLAMIFGINNVVIESLNLSEMPGKQNIQAYDIGLISDDDFEVIVQ